MSQTPICDFVAAYRTRGTLRLHMPGHKGKGPLGAEERDITEISGADVLYCPEGIIRRSEENAAALFGAGRTVYSAEGSSLCIRAMVCLALQQGKKQGRAPLILAGRNAHKAFLSAAALLGAEIRWLYPMAGDSLVSCRIGAEALEKALDALPSQPAAVYVTSPDYLGHMLDVAALARVCRRRQVPLLVDNAHGAYLKFLPQDRHPMTLGADMCCDSAHKTLPVLTGGAYLHIAKDAPALFFSQADRAMALFASTSPSYLVLQSLDACNGYLASDCRPRLVKLAERTAALKDALRQHGYFLAGEEPLKITLAPKSFGYTGHELHERLRRSNMEGEFSDPDFLTLMLAPENGEEGLNRLEEALLAVPRRAPVREDMPPLPRPERVLSPREAMLSPAEKLPVERALGRVLADAGVSCPPAVPIAICGERVDGQVVRCFRYYGINTCLVVAE